jgi:hypothetical protein
MPLTDCGPVRSNQIALDQSVGYVADHENRDRKVFQLGRDPGASPDRHRIKLAAIAPLSNDHQSGVNAGAESQLDAPFLHKSDIHSLYAFQDANPGMHGSPRIVLVDVGIPKVDQNAIAQILSNMPAKAVDHFYAEISIAGQHLMQLFGIKRLGKRSRGCHRTKHHCYLTAFGLG